MIKAFDRWCYKELFKTLFFCLSAFYLLYVLIDYSSRISSYQALRFEWWMLFEYYGLIFIRRLEALLPFALLIATGSTLQTIWQLHGWIPLMQGGRSLKKLLTPFYAAGIVCTLFLWVNEQSLIPMAMKRLNHIESLYFHKGEGISELNARSSLRLKEGGILFFDTLDAKAKALLDVWYLPHWNEIWHMEKLDLSKKRPLGSMVDHFNVVNHLIQEGQFQESTPFERMDVTWEDLLEASEDPVNLSITDLVRHQFDKGATPQEKNEGFATLIKKLLFPTLALFAVLGVIPFFVNFQRDPPFFFYYLASILAYIGFYLLISSLYLISAANVFSPLLAQLVPFSALCAYLTHLTRSMVQWKPKRTFIEERKRSDLSSMKV